MTWCFGTMKCSWENFFFFWGESACNSFGLSSMWNVVEICSCERCCCCCCRECCRERRQLMRLGCRGCCVTEPTRRRVVNWSAYAVSRSCRNCPLDAAHCPSAHRWPCVPPASDVVWDRADVPLRNYSLTHWHWTVRPSVLGQNRSQTKKNRSWSFSYIILVLQVWCCFGEHDLGTLVVIMILKDTATFQVPYYIYSFSNNNNVLGTSLLWISTVAFTDLKVKSAKCLCLLPVILVLVLRIWSCLHHCHRHRQQPLHTSRTPQITSL